MRGGFFSFTVLLAFSWCHVTALYICQHYAYNKLLHARASTTQPVHTAHLSHGKRLATLSIYTAEYRPSSPEWARKKVLFWTLGISGDISCLRCFLMSYTADLNKRVGFK